MENKLSTKLPWRLGGYLATIRKVQKYTLNDVGQKTGIPVQTLNQIENGKLFPPDKDTLLKLSDFYKVSYTGMQELINDNQQGE